MNESTPLRVVTTENHRYEHDAAAPFAAITPALRRLQLLVLGATGRTGRALLLQAVERGHRVTAFVRAPEKLGMFREIVAVRQGDPRNAEDLRRALAGHDAVVSVLGAPATGRTTLLRDCARSLINAMETEGLRRLLVVSAAVLFKGRVLAALLRNTFLRHVAEDAAEMERYVMSSDLEWTIARPPRLTNGLLTGGYRVTVGGLPPGRRSVSRADLAHFLLGEAETNAHVGAIVGMARVPHQDLAPGRAASISPRLSHVTHNLDANLEIGFNERATRKDAN